MIGVQQSMNSLLSAAGAALLPMAEKLPFGDVVAITFTGLAVVFLGLIILIVFVTLLGKFFTRSKKTDAKPPVAPPPAPPAPKTEVTPPTAADDDTAVVAAISAAIAAMGEAEGATYAIRSIRKKQPAAVGRPAWAMAGIRDNTTPF